MLFNSHIHIFDIQEKYIQVNDYSKGVYWLFNVHKLFLHVKFFFKEFIHINLEVIFISFCKKIN